MLFRMHLYSINLLFSSNPEILLNLINSTELQNTLPVWELPVAYLRSSESLLTSGSGGSVH